MQKNSRFLISKYSEIYSIFILPKHNLLNNQIEYIELNNIPNAVNIIIDILFSAIPIKIKSSPIKLEVPGKPKLANEKNSNIDAYIGILIAIPP